MKRGFPRPTADIDDERVEKRWGKKWNKRRYPWPYTASDFYIGESNNTRPRECIDEKLCGNCGIKVEEDLVHVIITNEPRSFDYVWYESGPFHEKCVLQVLTLCPAISEVFLDDGTKKYEHALAPWGMVAPMMLASF